MSELLRSAPNPKAKTWLDTQDPAAIYTTTINEAELLYGVMKMAAGKRRSALAEEIENMLRDDFQGRILPFDSPAAEAYATIAVNRRAAGQPISYFDCQIAAICQTQGAAIATRNSKDFDGCGIKIIDPWNL